jgi:glycosyltransferase involved in cell wall biosynthesis
MKHIGIDARLLFQTGVGTYLQNLLHYLPEYISGDVRFTIYCLPQDKDFIKKEVPQSHIHTTTALWHSLDEQTTFLSCINEDNLDLMHFTYFGHPVLYNKKYISTIHDVTPLLFKTGKASTKSSITYMLKHAVFSYVLKNQIEKSEAIITPTKTVKEQLAQLYGTEISQKITPVYEGVSYRLLAAKKTPTEMHKPYLLYVGNFYPHKNVLFMIQAFAKSNSPYSLVLAGPHDYFLKRILDSLTQNEKEHLIIKDKQSLSELASLYSNAEALIHPSVSEGFGLPLVEAMYFGLPIIASHIPVFQELLKTSYYSFDPYDKLSLIRTLNVFEKDAVKKKNELGREFSFQEMTKQTVDLYMRYA